MKLHLPRPCDPLRRGGFTNQLAPPRLTLVLLCAVALATSARASVLQDPLPEPSTTLFGKSIVSLGDITGDGVPDFVVAAPFQDGDVVSQAMGFGLPQNVGKLFVIDGATLAVLNLMNDPEFEVIQVQHFGGQLGASLAVSADINGDGVPDIIAGDPNHTFMPGVLDQQILNVGKALVFSGTDGSVLFTLLEAEPEEDGHFGAAVAAVGDVDSDGIPDFAVGTPGSDIGGEDGVQNVGAVFVYSGKTGQLIRTLNDPPRGGAEAGAAFGSALANAGDVDGDGVQDVVVGAPGEGRVYVFSGHSGNLLYSMISPLNDAIPSFGAAVAGGQDFTEDHKPDIVVGAPLSNRNQGIAYIYDGQNGTVWRKLKSPTPQSFANFGAAVYASTDITGHKHPDAIVGAPGQNVGTLLGAGQAFVFDGRGHLSSTLTSATPQDHAGFGLGLCTAVFPGSQVATPIVGAPYKDGVVDGINHLQLGQIEVMH